MKESKWSVTLRALGLLVLIGALTPTSSAAPGDVDLSFDPGSGVNGSVTALAVQPDGKVLIAGSFTTVKGLIRRGIARLNADGSGDPTFNPGTGIGVAGGMRAVVTALALQPDGKVLIAGLFDTVNGINRNQIARLNSDGRVDNSFVTSIDFVNPNSADEFGAFKSITLQPDGKVLVGGAFTTYDTNAYPGIVRFHSNGSFDNTFYSATSGIEDGSVSSAALQADGKVLIAGVLEISGTFPRILRLNSDGSRDHTFDSGSVVGGDGAVHSIVVQPDDKVLVGGWFRPINGTNRVGIARLNAGGSLDSSFNPGNVGVSGREGVVNAVVRQPDGKLLIAGDFSTVNGISRNKIARLNSNGSVDTAFNPSAGVAGEAPVNALALSPDNKAVIGRHGVARLNADGSPDDSFNPGSGVDGAVFSVVVQPDGRALIGGAFSMVKGMSSLARIARLNPNGSGDSSFNTGTAYYGTVRTIILQSDTKVLIRGHSITRLHANGSLDNTFSPDPEAGLRNSPDDLNEFMSLAVQPNGQVLVGGYTVDYFNCDEFGCQVQSIPFLQRLHSDGTRDGFDPSVSFTSALAVQPDGRVLAGGNFGNVVRFHPDGSSDGTFNPVQSGGIRQFQLQADGRILVGGAFVTVNGTNRNRIARLNAHGTLDTTFDPGAGADGEVLAVALQPDGKVLIGGAFTHFNGVARNRIARLHTNGSLDLNFNPDRGADSTVTAIALQPDGNILIAGDFLTVNGAMRPHVARLYNDSARPALSITRSNGVAVVSLPAAFGNFQLQQNTNVSLSNGWSPVAAPRSTNNGSISLTFPATGDRIFFRLRSP